MESSRGLVWFERDVKPRLEGEARLIRFADDAVMAFTYEQDAVRVLDVLHKRCAKYGLTLHPEKTKLVDFRRPALHPPKDGRQGRMPGTFDLLGFTQYWARSRVGCWVVKRNTMRARFRRALERATEWCKTNKRDAVREQWRAPSKKLNGHYAYYGITFNMRALSCFRYRVTLAWWRALKRRSQRGMSWSVWRNCYGLSRCQTLASYAC